MAELLFTPKHFEAAEATTCAAFETVDACFSTGFPHFEGHEQTPLTFHNGWHARAVSRGAVAVGAAVDLSRAESAIAEAAGAAHDIVQLKGRGIDEAESAEWLAEQLREAGIFPEMAVTIGSLAILGTQPLFDEAGRLVGQKATQLEYPSKRAELVAKSVASADLGELYTPQGPLLGHLLWQEIQKKAPGQTPSLKGLEAFQAYQVILLNSYNYPLAEAESVLASHRSQVTAYTERVLEQLRRGEIHSWQQLIEQDKEFMAAHS